MFKQQSECHIFYGEKQLRPLRASKQLYGAERDQKPKNIVWGKISAYSPTGLTLNSVETRVLNQEGTKECPTFAFVHAMEDAYANRAVNPINVEIDPVFLIAAKLRRYTEKAVDPDPSFQRETDAEAPMREGGEFHNVLDIALRYGLVPQSRWKPMLPLKDWPFATYTPTFGIYSQVKKSIEDTNSALTTGTLDKVEKSDPGYMEWKRQMAKSITDNIISPYLGQWPKPFEWQGKFNYTPISFAHKIGPSRTEIPKLIYMTQFPYFKAEWSDRLIPYFGNFPNSKNPFLHSQLSQEHFYNSILQGLREGSGIVLDMDGETVFENGIAKKYGHAFAVVDIEVQNNKVTAIKLKNSFENWGINGYAWFRVDEITSQARRAWVFGIQ